jgi:hypothetical protein
MVITDDDFQIRADSTAWPIYWAWLKAVIAMLIFFIENAPAKNDLE